MEDPASPLEYALFHLTPTRTRCDLVVFSVGGGGEKIASGLLEPFLSHLGYARDEIPKGGYSLTLRPNSPSPPSWFTKSTLERFVRFVSTPEILERVATIERELEQIDRSIQSADYGTTTPEALNQSGKSQTDQDSKIKKSTVPFKLQAKRNDHDIKQGENSKLCLQRVLETRKVVLQKEQGMAYARASVAGFQLDHIEDLVLFADAFGATRLREACLNFKDLCKKKEKDKSWIDELAAMEAYSQPEGSYFGTSGIMLTSESFYKQSNKPEAHEATDQFRKNDTANGSIALTKTSESSKFNQDDNLQETKQKSLQAVDADVDGKPSIRPNHPPAHVYNSQASDAQGRSSNQGYAFPGMQLLLSPYYQGHPGNMQWPQHIGLQDHRISQNADHRGRSKKLPRASRTKSNSSRLKGVYSDQSSSDLSSEPEEKQDIAFSSHDETIKSEDIKNRRPKKKSSNKVVIRNINYISSKRKDGRKDESSDESLTRNFLDKVENVVDTIHKHQKSGRYQYKENSSRKEDHGESGSDSSDIKKDNESWQDFQNILMKQESSACNDTEECKNEGAVPGCMQNQVEVEDDYGIALNQEMTQQSVEKCTLDAEYDSTKNQLVEIETLVITERDANTEYAMKNFECEESYNRFVKRTEGGSEELLYMKNPQQEDVIQYSSSDHTEEVSALRSQRGGDCFIVDRFYKSTEVQGSVQCSMYESEQTVTLPIANQNNMVKNEKKLLIDDSFVVPTRSTRYDHNISEWEMDISMVSGIPLAAATGQTQKGDPLKENIGTHHYCEPDDLQMVLERDFRVETACWTHEIDYSAEVTSKRVNISGAETNLTNDVPTNCKEGKKHVGTEEKSLNRDSKKKPLVGYLGKSKSEVMSKNRKLPTMNKETLQKSKREKEEENRRRIEESLAERQKRIAQKSGSKHIPTTQSTERLYERKAAADSLSHDRKTSRFTVQLIERSKLHKSYVTEAMKGHHINKQKKQNGATLLSNIKQELDPLQ
ncbi:COP1-interacting protein 7-like [Typha latifolia]|uniref:COP1-interacting protein 7-like n=1 Tax=Typha latifolia TaxID=4733 RepID=UPI003C30AE3F